MPTFTGGSSGYSPLILSGGGGGGSTDALTVYASGVAGESLSVGDVVRFDRVGSPERLLKAIATSDLSATSGQATLTPPGSGSVVYRLGIVFAASGTTTAQIAVQPQYVAGP